MRVLVTGSRGQLGNEIRRCLESMQAEAGFVPSEYAGAQADFIDYDELDISNGHAVAAWFKSHGPYDVVFNCAAMTNVDGCELDEAAALLANAIGPKHMAHACEACGATFIQVSTDYVFSGMEQSPRRETDPIGPVSAYGRSKLAGELLAMNSCAHTHIVRTAWLFGYMGRNFVKTMLRLAREQGFVAVVDDQLGNPTSANDLAYQMLRIALTDEYGVWHCTGNGICSWYDFACAILDMAGIECPREALSSDEYKRRFPASAARPAYSALDNARLRATIGDGMRPWKEALSDYMTNLPLWGD